MKESAPQNPITRRGFLELASVLASAGVVAKATAETAALHAQSGTLAGDLDAALAHGKVALEEHFTLGEIIEDSRPHEDWLRECPYAFSPSAISGVNRIRRLAL